MSDTEFSEQVIKFILTRNDDELGALTIEKVTGMLDISRSHLYQLFKDEKKFTPREFLVMIKMVRSALLLADDKGLSVEKIAEKMGFSSIDYFKRVFKNHFGTTPGRYRKYVRGKL
jgi:AraC-like DNA-binding protein